MSVRHAKHCYEEKIPYLRIHACGSPGLGRMRQRFPAEHHLNNNDGAIEFDATRTGAHHNNDD
jgi:hypothetical protein